MPAVSMGIRCGAARSCSPSTAGDPSAVRTTVDECRHQHRHINDQEKQRS